MPEEKQQALVSPVQPVQEVQPSSELPKRKSRLPKIVILLVVILLIGGGVIYAVKRLTQPKVCTLEAKICPDGSTVGRVLPNCEFAPCPTQGPPPTTTTTAATTATTPDDTANWKSYTNTEYGFSVKYPDSMEAIPIQKRDEMLLGGVRFNLIYKDNQFRPQASEIHVWVYDGKNLSLDQWLSDNSTSQPFGSAAEKEFYNFKKTGTSNLGSKNGISFTNEAFGFNDTETAVKKGNFIYMVGYVKVSDDLSSVFDQILSTFKFTD